MVWAASGTSNPMLVPIAMVHDPDTTYLYFGWWLSKDKDGAPTAGPARSRVWLARH